MKKILLLCLLLTILTNNIQAQDKEGIIALEASQELVTQRNQLLTEVVPTINSSMDVNASGAMIYNVPIEVLPGINNFQPNLSISYNSQAGNGQVGWGWNLIGLSVITQGGTSKEIEGITRGEQFTDVDPWYLDGQRLISKGNSQYETQIFSSLKITRQIAGEYSFIIQYPDGRIAKYKSIATRQHYISVLIDSQNNEIHYNYEIESNIPYLQSISYGGNSLGTDPYKVDFLYRKREVPIKYYRNGIEYINNRLLAQIIVSSTENGIYRKYTFVNNQAYNGSEILQQIQVENAKGEKLRPLQFYYNQSSKNEVIKTSTPNHGWTFNDIKSLESVATGDFRGIGTPYPIYNLKTGEQYRVVDSKSNEVLDIRSDEDTQLFNGKTLLNDGVLTTQDQIIAVNTEFIGSSYNNGFFTPRIKVNIIQKDLLTGKLRHNTFFSDGHFEKTIHPTDNECSRSSDCSYYKRSKDFAEIVVADFNNDGLTDILIRNEVSSSNVEGGGRPYRIPDLKVISKPTQFYFIEIGKIQKEGEIQPEIFTSNVDKLGTPIEFDGDGIPELASTIVKVDRRISETLQIAKVNILEKTITKIDIGEVFLGTGGRAPIVWGDFNGDGLTDFMLPNQRFSLYNDRFETRTAQDIINQINTETLLWGLYVNTGKNFIKKELDLTQQKLAFITPSGRDVIKKSSSWDKFWSGKPDKIAYSEYGTSYIIPVDFDQDGKMDLVSVRKFTRLKQNGENLNNLNIENLNLNAPNANQITFHKSFIDKEGNVSFMQMGNKPISLDNELLSAYSLIISSTDNNKLNNYQSTLTLHDPATRRDLNFIISTEGGLETARINTINNGSGVIQNLEYRPMVDESQNLLQGYEKIYTTAASSKYKYPYYIQKNQGGMYLLHKSTSLFDGKSLTKEYRYENGIQHLEGKGFLGFEKTMISDPYESKQVNIKYSDRNREQAGEIYDLSVLYTPSRGGSNNGQQPPRTIGTPPAAGENTRAPVTGGGNRSRPIGTPVTGGGTIQTPTGGIRSGSKENSNTRGGGNRSRPISRYSVGDLQISTPIQLEPFRTIGGVGGGAQNNTPRPPQPPRTIGGGRKNTEGKSISTYIWDKGTVFWKVNKFIPEMDMSLVESTYGSLNETEDASIFSRKRVQYKKFEKREKYYLILPEREENIDLLNKTESKKILTYDENSLLLTKTETLVEKEQISEITQFVYNPDFYNGEHYFSGRIKQAEQIQKRKGESFTTKEENIYNNKGLLFQSKKYGNNTQPIITEYTYDSYGNILTQKVSSSQTSIQPLITKYEYDSSHRFVIKTTTPEGLFSTKEINYLGLPLSETSPLGHKTTFEYDSWGNPVKVKDYLGISTVTSKRYLTNGLYEISVQREGEAPVIETYDKFDRKVKTQTRSLGSWIYTETEYDIFGRLIRASEPYKEGETPLWNTTEYDELGRPIKQTLYNGKTITTCYDGLRVTVDDGYIKTSELRDSSGLVIEHEDRGGKIIYSYYPNGTLKEANYDGIYLRMKQDGWGNRTELVDPSAGTYRYTYDNLGKILKEISPKGETHYTYDILGKLLKEKITGAHTDIEKNYEYDPKTHLVTKIFGQSGAKEYRYETYYDQYYRIKGKREITPYLITESEIIFDAKGRTSQSNQKIQIPEIGHTSFQRIQNIYNEDGELVKLINPDKNKLIWELKSANAQGQVTQLQYGNGFDIYTEYGSLFDLKKIQHQRANQKAVHLEYQYDIKRGVLENRSNLIFDKKESFVYDGLNRLIEERQNTGTIQKYTYDKRGRMTYNSALGEYKYTPQHYRLNGIALNAAGIAEKEKNGFPQIVYNSFKMPVEVSLEGKERVYYEYGILENRSAYFYGDTGTQPQDKPNKVYYSTDGSVELNKKGNSYELITYIWRCLFSSFSTYRKSRGF